MKYLVLFAVLLVVYLVWRAQRAEERRTEGTSRPAPQALVQQEMVRCTVCAVHLPREDALAGGSGRLYCSAEHRRSGGN